MKWFFDTSALIPVFLEDHEHHEASLQAFLKADKTTACCGAHSLAEIYAVLTRLPGPHRLNGDQILLLLENIRERLMVVALSAENYFSAVRECAEMGIVGGTVYDALLVYCARKVQAKTIYTWNVRHFQPLSSTMSHRVTTPPAVG